jgi:predicted DNA-binding transcriptional regulator AlpA
MNDKRLLNFNEVVEKFSFKPWGLRWRIRLRQIPFVKIGRSIYFDPLDLEEWIEKHKIRAQGEGKKGGER